MAYVFPGMDPYLEDPDLWPGVHNTFIVYVRDALRPLLRPRYIASVEERVYLEGPAREIVPDVWIRHSGFGPVASGAGGGAVAVAEADAAVVVEATPPGLEVRETYLAILDLASDRRVVTVLELVSPSNKYVGAGRDSYIAKQREVIHSDAHLVEIDLLRAGPHVLAVPESDARPRFAYDYLVSVNRAARVRRRFELYPRTVRQRLPRVGIPLAAPDPDAPLDLQAVLARTYEAGDYDLRIDYARPCRPPLPPEDQAWAEERIRAAREGGAPAAGP